MWKNNFPLFLKIKISFRKISLFLSRHLWFSRHVEYPIVRRVEFCWYRFRGSSTMGKPRAIYPRIRKSCRSRNVFISWIGLEERRKERSVVLAEEVFYRGYDFAATFQSRLVVVTQHGQTIVQTHRMRWAKDKEVIRVRTERQRIRERRRGAKLPLRTDADTGPNRNIDLRVNAPRNNTL